MTIKNKRTFLTWNRENQSAFAAAVSEELDKKAGLDSAEFTGTPTAPTAAKGTNTKQIATTAFVAESLSGIRGYDGAPDKVSKTGDTITGELIIGNSATSTNLRFVKMAGATPIGGYITDNGQGLKFGSANNTLRTDLYAMSNGSTLGFYPLINNLFPLGNSIYKWTHVYAAKLNNGADIVIPAKAGTLALLSDIEDVLKQHGLI